jgi:hypothetical protein
MPDATRNVKWFQMEYHNTFRSIAAFPNKFVFYKTNGVTKTDGGRGGCSFFVSGLDEYLPFQMMTVENEEGKLMPYPEKDPETAVEPITKPDFNPDHRILQAQIKPVVHPVVSQATWTLMSALGWLDPAVDKVWDPLNKDKKNKAFEEKGLPMIVGEYDVFDEKVVQWVFDQFEEQNLTTTIVCW